MDSFNVTDYSDNGYNHAKINDLIGSNKEEKDIFNSLFVESLLFVVYSLVFIMCFIGNSLVIAVLALNREIQTMTNFLLLNLAIADLCVALFCVYQNLSIYIFKDWAFGDLMCRMYHFIHALSYTASVYILVLISIERYLALVYPLLSRRLLTMKKLKITVMMVWLLSAICCSPRFVIFGTVTFNFGSDGTTLCVLKQKVYDAKMYDLCYISLCFIIPLIIISVSYLRICYHLHTSPLPGYSLQANMTKHRKNSSIQLIKSAKYSRENIISESSIKLLLKRRKKVIKLLIVIVLAFAFFSAPFHVRKLAQHFIKSYPVDSDYATMFTIFTTLLLYSNSGVNPLIYLVFSKKLRALMIDAVVRLFNKIQFIHKYQNSLEPIIESRTHTSSHTNTHSSTHTSTHFLNQILCSLHVSEDSTQIKTFDFPEVFI